jgi:hypothetical protein
MTKTSVRRRYSIISARDGTYAVRVSSRNALPLTIPDSGPNRRPGPALMRKRRPIKMKTSSDTGKHLPVLRGRSVPCGKPRRKCACEHHVPSKQLQGVTHNLIGTVATADPLASRTDRPHASDRCVGIKSFNTLGDRRSTGSLSRRLAGSSRKRDLGPRRDPQINDRL